MAPNSTQNQCGDYVNYTQNIIDACEILHAQKVAVVFDSTPAFHILSHALTLLEAELKAALTGPKPTATHRHSCECGDYRVCSQKSCPTTPWVCPECDREALFADICGWAAKAEQIEASTVEVKAGDEGFIRSLDEGIRKVTIVQDGWVILAGGISCKAEDFVVTAKGQQ
jgi:hypothetical protein